jgi:hypothetical protein
MDVPLIAAPVPVPRRVASGRGWTWLREAFDLFKQAPGTWIVIVLIYLVIDIVGSMLPGGSLLTTLLGQVFGGGLMLACAAADSGQKPKIGQLFAGFSGGRFGPLLLLAILYMGAMLILAVFGLLLALAFSALPLSEIRAMDLTAPDAVIEQLMPQLLSNLPLILVVLILVLLYIPLVMGLWLAPALIVLRGQQPIAAFKLSLRACVINAVPFLVYGAFGLLLTIAASIPLLLGWLVAAPVFFISIYTSYRDIFPLESDLSMT